MEALIPQGHRFSVFQKHCRWSHCLLWVLLGTMMARASHALSSISRAVLMPRNVLFAISVGQMRGRSGKRTRSQHFAMLGFKKHVSEEQGARCMCERRLGCTNTEYRSEPSQRAWSIP